MHHHRDLLLAWCLVAAAALPSHSLQAAALKSQGELPPGARRQRSGASPSRAAFAVTQASCRVLRGRKTDSFAGKGCQGGRGGGAKRGRGKHAPFPPIAKFGKSFRGGESNMASACQRGGGGGGGGGKIALVTGANRGLGKGLVQELAANGFAVIACCRDKKKGDELAREIHAPGCDVISFELDVSSEQSIRALSTAIDRGSLPSPHLLINNAGVCTKGSSREILRQTLDVNFYGALRMIRALSPAMREKCGSHVINISSGEGELVYLCSRLQQKIPLAESVEELTTLLESCLETDEELAFGETAAYSVSKAALNALTRILAAEEGEGGIGIRAVCPGDVDTAMCMLDDKGDVLSPGEAARHVVWVATHTDECRSGLFFRAREQIPW